MNSFKSQNQNALSKKYVLKIRDEYLLELGMWSRFTRFIYYAQRFDTFEEAENAKTELCDENYYHNFSENQVEIVPIEIKV